MGRAWRIEFEGALYHVLSRGNERKAIFYSDKDRHLFLETISEMSERFAVDIFAYVLMENHYHLLLRTNRANLSKSMQWLGVTYTRRFNNRHHRAGHLFQGRFKAILVQNDAYMMELSCYIHRNPLRAGLVDSLVRYPWSSYPVYAYSRKIPQWLSTELLWSQFTGKDKHRAYRKKVEGYAEEETRLLEDMHCGMVLGNEDFLDTIRSTYLPDRPHHEIPQQRKIAMSVNPLQLIDKAARLLDNDIEHFRHTARISTSQKDNRDVLVFFLWSTGLMTNQQIGTLFGLTYSSVSHIVSLMKPRVAHEPELQKKVAVLNSQYKM